MDRCRFRIFLWARCCKTYRAGSIIVLSAFLMIVFMAVMAFAVDLGYLRVVQAELQNAADGAAMGAVRVLPADSTGAALVAARNMAGLNHAQGGDSALLVSSADIEPGTWNSSTFVFTPSGDSRLGDTVRVTVHRSESGGNPVGLFFAKVLGRTTADVQAVAIATRKAKWNIIAANKLQIGDGSTISGVSAYGRQRVELGGGVSVVDGARIGSLPGSVVQYSSAVGLPENLVRDDVQPELANRVSSLISDIENSIDLPSQITRVETLSSWPPSVVRPNTAYVVNSSVDIPSHGTLTLSNNIIAARGTIHFGEGSHLFNPGSSSVLNTALLATQDVQIGQNAAIHGVDIVAGYDIQIGQELQALEIGTMQAKHDIQLGQGPTLSGLGALGGKIRIVQ